MQLPILVGLALSTLISEDLALVAGGLLAQDERVSLSHAVVAGAVGVYLGDLGLWGAGRLLGRRVLLLPWFRTRVDFASLAAAGHYIDSHLPLTIFISRFAPGTRLPVYLAAGIFGRRPVAFAGWSLLAVLVWAPLLVVSTAYFGDAIVTPFLRGIEASFVSVAATALAGFGLGKLFGRVATWTLRGCDEHLDQTIETTH